jgi:hypothetical protein
VPCRPEAITVSAYEFTMSLRIRHPRIDPAEITRTLGLEPQYAWRVGDDRREPKGGSIGGKYHESLWMCSLMPEPELSGDQVGVESELLRALGALRRSFDFLRALRDDGGVAEIHVSIFAREEFRLEFLGESLAVLGRMGVTFALEINPHSTAPVTRPLS